MFGLDFITKMISPSKGVDMLKKGIENVIGESIEHFEVIYADEKEEIFFKVWTSKGIVKQPYTGSNKEMIIFAVKNVAKMNLKEGETLDFFKCERVEGGLINLNVYVTKGGEKIEHKFLNYKP